MQQNQNTIANPKMPYENQVKGPAMNDRDRANDCLASCKYLTDNLNIMAREASHRQLHQDVLGMLVETHQSCREIFNLMFEQGNYKLEAEESTKIQQARTQFQNYAQTQLNAARPDMMQ